ncbi:Multidrug export protein AcrF [Rhodopseudomonas palustris]|uniref:Efflux pump membrane transporter n=2 Tax=Rhodopseudomonas TaxID=1073 RepID=Q6N2Z4_RHOPA|nr:efflux RND transporter permease subunit [Rhodopseudomonas palustris]OPF92676.1 multidrug efflux RND transporter permease subunit [Rhodopseudomonas palustris]QQM05462.1 Multidrug export protein AcrF [Rhodopseudomonas palustris]WAB76801.1 efflux RND transporter permease subunit [Rhodopseudomonas palustris]WCL94088.1 efflux RND transporter permease subunit [Rhodopseudomonas palustris CGA009]WND50713.1 multidrug efflux RND transporter permease subunit [Rhodopseudomonas palustris]
MPDFFIARPVFAWVVAIFIMIAGALAIPFLPVAQYPNIAPAKISVTANYPGASSEEIYQGVVRLIEDQLAGIPGLMYFESTTDATGQISIEVSFQPGTSLAQATVDVQNRIRRVESRLPSAVTQRGILVDEASSTFLMFISVQTTDGSLDSIAVGDYITRNIISEIRRVEGVGKAQLFGTQRSMRVWIDPDKLFGVGLTVSDVSAAIAAQNAQVAAGRIGATPNPVSQEVTAPVLVKGQLGTPEEFGAIVLRANRDGSSVRLRDVARVEVGGEDYNSESRLNGQPAASIGVQLSATANALATSRAVTAKMKELSQYFPKGMTYEIPYDTTPFIKASIEKVLYTLAEAIALVFVVMFLFLQNIRYTLIPTLVVPIALLGTCAVMFATGFSINVLTMFAMVLAIGILVDDAIVVVENVERLMATEGLSPREATIKAMKQIKGAIVGITLVLTAVFLPMAFFPGAVGIIYRQFSLTMVVSILFSSFLALTLTPALCATFLKPVPDDHHEKGGFFGWFNRTFARIAGRYRNGVGWATGRTGRLMVVYLALLAGLGWAYLRLPASFLPTEDQGYLIVDMQAPTEATQTRAMTSIEQAEKVFLADPSVSQVFTVSGFSFSGNSQSAAVAFVTLKDWSERGHDSAGAIARRANVELAKIGDAAVMAFEPPPIDGLGNFTGFTFRLQDRGSRGTAALDDAATRLTAAGAASPVLTGVRVEGLANSAQLHLVIDREKANALGVSFADINATITASLGSAYVNDFPNAGRMQRVTIQAQDDRRMQTDDLLKLNVRNASGRMVPLSAFARTEWSKGPIQVIGFNGYPSVRFAGDAAPGHSSGEAIAEMERLAKQLPSGFGFEWAGQSLQEIKSGNQAPFLLGLSVLFVFLLLAALYESWSIPLSVMLVVPLGVIGALLAVMLRDMPNDIYFKVGLIAIIGLSAKNAILIVEFAEDLHAEGKSLREAAIEAAAVRFRPIIMTSLAFILGVTPLAFASGVSAGSQNAIGTGVFGGMLSPTVLAVLFVPVFYVFVLQKVEQRKAAGNKGATGKGEPQSTTVARS